MLSVARKDEAVYCAATMDRLTTSSCAERVRGADRKPRREKAQIDDRLGLVLQSHFGGGRLTSEALSCSTLLGSGASHKCPAQSPRFG